MMTLGSFIPELNKSVAIPLILRDGYTEIINDTNLVVTINAGSGQCTQPPGVAQIYVTPSGGGTFTIGTFFEEGTTTTQGDIYLIQDMGPCGNITVNQYEEDELVGRTYPYFLPRSVMPMINVIGSLQATATVASMANTLTASISGISTIFPDSAHVQLQGIDLTVDQEGTAHGFTLTYGPFFTGGVNFTAVFHTTTAGAYQYSRIFDPPIPAQLTGGNSTITATVAGVAGATARGALNIWGCYQ
jgi:hypothetical protein